MPSSETPVERVILGIDPGTTIMGYGIIRSTTRDPVLEALGILELHKFDDHFQKLQKIFDRVLGLIDSFHPTEVALEAPFFGKNVQSMLKLGRAQGVAMSAALARNLPIFEYSPRKIKLAITGNGNASKEQVAAMLLIMLKLEEIPLKLDATDGLAVAVTHHYNMKSPQSQGGARSWKEFIAKNPSRLKS
jgi:crossover junction endodeoxyribonuclease RuvC